MERALEAFDVARAEAGIGAAEVRPLERPEARERAEAISQRFTGRKRPPPWWERLTGPSDARRFPDFDAFSHLLSVVPDPDEPCWLLLPDGEGTPGIVEVTPRSAQAIIAASTFSEYYLVSQSLEWLVCENDHGVMIATGTSVVGTGSR